MLEWVGFSDQGEGIIMKMVESPFFPFDVYAKDVEIHFLHKSDVIPFREYLFLGCVSSDNIIVIMEIFQNISCCIIRDKKEND